MQRPGKIGAPCTQLAILLIRAPEYLLSLEEGEHLERLACVEELIDLQSTLIYEVGACEGPFILRGRRGKVHYFGSTTYEIVKTAPSAPERPSPA